MIVLILSNLYIKPFLDNKMSLLRNMEPLISSQSWSIDIFMDAFFFFVFFFFLSFLLLLFFNFLFCVILSHVFFFFFFFFVFFFFFFVFFFTGEIGLMDTSRRKFT